MDYAVKPIKAIGSRKALSANGGKVSRLYHEAVSDLLQNPAVMRLDLHKQHLNTSRLQHSINVSFYSFRVARLFGFDAVKTARAALLHDMYYYDFKNAGLSCKEHSSLHSKLALENAEKITKITDVEADIILTHMWPMTSHAPKNIEGYIVTFADKLCTIFEVLAKLSAKILMMTND